MSFTDQKDSLKAAHEVNKLNNEINTVLTEYYSKETTDKRKAEIDVLHKQLIVELMKYMTLNQ